MFPECRVACCALGPMDGPLTVSMPERALLEPLDELPQHESFDQVDVLMENLSDLAPKRLQKLLVRCRSVKVKRLFFFLPIGIAMHGSSMSTDRNRSGVGQAHAGQGRQVRPYLRDHRTQGTDQRPLMALRTRRRVTTESARAYTVTLGSRRADGLLPYRHRYSSLSAPLFALAVISAHRAMSASNGSASSKSSPSSTMRA